MLAEFIIWWYSKGIGEAWNILALSIYKISDFFSIDILFKTLFYPWKNDVIAARNISLGDQLKIFELNIVTRLIGMFLRLCVILAGLIIISTIAAIGLVGLSIWLIMPIMPVLILIMAFWIGRGNAV